jgi:UDP:flavonoid glycosyltransferase YjiC (YdhE family)
MKIGFLSLPVTGHLNPMTGLARKLQSRGHEVVFIGVPDTERAIRAADLQFVPFCENEYPPGSIDESWGAVANLRGLDVIRRYELRAGYDQRIHPPNDAPAVNFLPPCSSFTYRATN